jgi:Voltage gated chloride channel
VSSWESNHSSRHCSAPARHAALPTVRPTDCVSLTSPTLPLWPTDLMQVFRRAAASVVTLGSGASLGPEAPSVELGANTAAVLAPKHLSKRRQRMLVAAGAAAGACVRAAHISDTHNTHCVPLQTHGLLLHTHTCSVVLWTTSLSPSSSPLHHTYTLFAGSAPHAKNCHTRTPPLFAHLDRQPPGVSAAFDAPATGALFAIEFVLKSSRLGLDRLSTSTVFASTSVAAGVIGFLRGQGQALGITGAATHLVGRIPYFSINPNLLTDVLQVSAVAAATAAAVAIYSRFTVDS